MPSQSNNVALNLPTPKFVFLRQLQRAVSLQQPTHSLSNNATPKLRHPTLILVAIMALHQIVIMILIADAAARRKNPAAVVVVKFCKY